MAYFDFSRLIKKYSRNFTVIVKGEKSLNDAGDWVRREATEYTLNGAIIGIAQKVVHRSEGKLTEKDKALYMLEPIDKALMSATVVFKGNEYRIEGENGDDNAEFTGCYSYTLKYVSAFNGGGKNV